MNGGSEKIAVVLLNLGGPDRQESIKPFLYNFFMDKNIIALPKLLRRFVAWRISEKRGSGAAKKAYDALGGASPLLANTQAQAQALETRLKETNANVKVFVSMRYWHPMSDETVRAVKAYGAARVILVPLYPQFSTTTSFSSFEDWDRAAAEAGLSVSSEKICCYPEDNGFIAASAALVRDTLVRARDETQSPLRLLFSAHGLPEKVIRAGDPYQYQCEKAAEKIAAAAGLQAADWQICYQSRVGPLKWIGPSTEEALAQAAKDGVGVVIYPHAFVSEHVETLVEIEQEYRHLAAQKNIPYFARVPTVSTHPVFIDGLARMVEKTIAGEKRDRYCPAQWTRCGCNL